MDSLCKDNDPNLIMSQNKKLFVDDFKYRSRSKEDVSEARVL